MKRKSGQNNKLVLTDRKHSGRSPIQRIPEALLLYMSEFLNNKDFMSMILVSQRFQIMAKQWMLNSYKKKLDQYGYTLSSKEKPDTTLQKKHRNLVQICQGKYYTLVDKRYAGIFDVLEFGDSKLAITLLEQKILDNDGVNIKNITDMVFFQKMLLAKALS